MFPGQVPWESPVKVAPKVAISGTPTVVPPPVWANRAPIPTMMNANQQQAMAYVLQVSGQIPENNGYPVMPNEYLQQYVQQQMMAQSLPIQQQPQMQMQNDGNQPDSPGNVSAAWRRRQRRRAQRFAQSPQKAGGDGMTGPPNQMVSPANNLASQFNMTQNGSPPAEEQEVPDGELLVGDPHILVLNNDLANEAVERLETGTRDQRNELLQWVLPATLDLALSAYGCRVVQAAVEVAIGEHRSEMTRHMHGHVAELLDSPHGNHVLQKCIEVLPPDTVQFVLNELSAFPDHGLSIARHRFGCRILERLLEHCPSDQTRTLTEGVIENAYVLCRHPFGNYVVQHVLEYGTANQRSAVIDAILNGGVMQLAMHRVASNVIERALVECTAEGRHALVGQLVSEPSAALAMASSRYGSFIAQRLLELPASPQRDEIKKQFSEGLEILKASKHGKQLVATIAPEEAETESGPENDQAEASDDS